MVSAFGWSVTAGAVPSPNIWDYTELYEAENRAVDPDGVIEAAIAELAAAPGQLGDGWGDVLDVGCGTGFHLPRLAERARTVIGVEPHGGLVARATAPGRVAAERDGASGVGAGAAVARRLRGPGARAVGVLLRPRLRAGAARTGAGAAPRRTGGGARPRLDALVDRAVVRGGVGRGRTACTTRTASNASGRAGASNGARLDIRWHFASRADLAEVLTIEFPASVVANALREVDERGGGWDVDAAVNLWCVAVADPPSGVTASSAFDSRRTGRAQSMQAFGRWMAFLGAGAVAVSALLPWVRVEGIPLRLDLLGTDVSAIEQTVSGTDTAAWPALLAVAALGASLALAGRGRMVLVALGALTVVAGAGLLYYLANVIDIETSDRSLLEQTLADVAVRSSVQTGPILLILGGAGLVLGGSLARGPARR